MSRTAIEFDGDDLFYANDDEILGQLERGVRPGSVIKDPAIYRLWKTTEGRKQQALKSLPIQRTLLWRFDHDGNPNVKMHHTDYQRHAALIFCTGRKVGNPCTKCVALVGPFRHCVVSSDGTGPEDCANCLWRNRGTEWTRRGVADVIDDELSDASEVVDDQPYYPASTRAYPVKNTSAKSTTLRSVSARKRSAPIAPVAGPSSTHSALKTRASTLVDDSRRTGSVELGGSGPAPALKRRRLVSFLEMESDNPDVHGDDVSAVVSAEEPIFEGIRIPFPLKDPKDLANAEYLTELIAETEESLSILRILRDRAVRRSRK